MLSITAGVVAVAAFAIGLRDQRPASVGDQPVVLAADATEPQRTAAPPVPTATGQAGPPAPDDQNADNPDPNASARGERPPPGAQDGTQPPRPAEPVAEVDAPPPTRLHIDRTSVDAPIVPLGKTDAGALEVPADVAETGWWTGGPEPGEQGPAVIVGHVDSWEGPGVFKALHELEPGDPIDVDREDGSTVRFVVRRVEQHAKDQFPTDRVYGQTTEPALRLITCGGGFDEDDRSYLDNVIVFADLAPRDLAFGSAAP